MGPIWRCGPTWRLVVGQQSGVLAWRPGLTHCPTYAPGGPCYCDDYFKYCCLILSRSVLSVSSLGAQPMTAQKLKKATPIAK